MNNDMTAQEYYEKLTEYTRQYVQATQALERLEAHRPAKQVELPLPIIEDAAELEQYFKAQDDLASLTSSWQKQHDTLDTEQACALVSLRDMIPDSMRSIWFKVDLDGKAWGVKKYWANIVSRSMVQTLPWDRVLDFFSEEDTTDE